MFLMIPREITALALLAIGALAGPVKAAEGEVKASFLGPTPQAIRQGHVVPVDKKMSPAWVRSLVEKGDRKVYRGKELFTIGMPCGGVGAGQMYVRGDGTLAKWWIFNNARNERGCSGYQTYRPKSPIVQGFALRFRAGGEKPQVVTLSEEDFDAIEFVGEYPIAEIRYLRKAKPSLPVRVSCEVFSPWIPLNARDSANPATVLQFTVENTGDTPVEASIAGWLQNGVCLKQSMIKDRGGRAPTLSAAWRSRNTVIREGKLTGVQMDLAAPAGGEKRETRPDIVFETFEDGTFAKWTVRGEAFGKGPREIAKHQHPKPVTGHVGKYLADSLGPKGAYDTPTGKLTSKAFKVERGFISFRIGGGRHAGRTCMNLLVGGKVVRSAVGENTETLISRWWDVSDLRGKEGVLEIVDNHTGGWGHTLVDHIVFTDVGPPAEKLVTENNAYGDMMLSAMDSGATACAAWESKEKFVADLAGDGRLSGPKQQVYRLETVRCGAVASSARLGPRKKATFTFLVTWYFPNRKPHGNMYANWYGGSLEVARHIAANFKRLHGDTHLFRDTYFDTTLPYWFVHRVGMPVANLASGTVEWWKNGRFYGWEGVMCCHGSCTHVWHYEQATGRLFPELARSMRRMQNLVEMDMKTGVIGFRGGGRNYAADGQAGAILMVYREHLMSRDRKFLDEAWPRIKRAIACMIARDGPKPDGIVATSDHTTYDINFVGANTHTGSMYLAALRACEKMAELQGEDELARRYRAIHESGSRLAVEKQFNGDYFIQLIPEGASTKWQIGKGCLNSQLLGNGWADQVNLPSVYPEKVVAKTLRSIFRYNWIPDIGPYYKRHKPEMVFVKPGEAGLIICTYPLGSRLPQPLRYRNTIMMGFDYNVANQMLTRGMLTEGFAIYRAYYDNYDGAKHNPWNEQQCGDHYARAMAAWGGLVAISGYVYDGPAGKIGFAPRYKPEDFRAFFTAAGGWGSLVQKRTAKSQSNRIDVKWGDLRVRTLIFEVPEGKKLTEAAVTAGDKRIKTTFKQAGSRVTLSLAAEVTAKAGQSIRAVLSWRQD